MPSKILFVDDEAARHETDPENYMRYYIDACRENGLEVYTAEGVDEALKVLKPHQDISLIIVDLLMNPGVLLKREVPSPFETGVHFAAYLQRHFPTVPLLVLTNAHALANTTRLRKLTNTKRVLFKDQTTPFQVASIVKQVLGHDSSGHSLTATPSEYDWKSLLDGKKQKAFSTFLSNPSKLTSAEFFLLAEVNQDIMRKLLTGIAPNTAAHSGWSAATLQQLLGHLETATEDVEKGKLLEELLARLLETIPGFTVKTHFRSRTEEIDIFVLNGSKKPPWRDMGPALLGECKRWDVKSGAKEYRDFAGKIRSKRGQCKCGFFVSWSGFTKPFLEEDLRASKEGYLIIRLEKQHLRSAVANGDFQSLLTKLWHEALQT